MNNYSPAELLAAFGGTNPNPTCKRERERVADNRAAAAQIALHMDNIDREARRIQGIQKAAAKRRSNRRKQNED